MPKEIVHWTLAEQTAERLGRSAFGPALRAYPHVLKLGAICPDLPYFLLGEDAWIQRCRLVGNEYHGAQGEDTYALVRRILSLRPAGGGLPPAQQAFLVGVVSHLQADMVFHPLIYYLTGNYYDADPVKCRRAVRDHRRWEVVLDLLIGGSLRKVPAYSAKKICTNLECAWGELIAWAQHDAAHPDLYQGLLLALEHFQKLQSWFIRPWAARLADSLDPRLPDALREITALFYLPSLARYVPRLAAPLSYQNPITGEPATAAVQVLVECAVDRAVTLCRRLEALAVQGSVEDWTEPGPSLNFGLVGARVSDAKYFSATSFFDT